MKKIFFISLIAGIVSCTSGYDNSWIRINQLGYMPGTPKIAVMVSKENVSVSEFAIYSAVDDQEVFRSEEIAEFDEWGAFKKGFRLDFTQFTDKGEFYVKVKNVKSPVFRIDNDVYANTADFILNYMRQQRCGYNTFYNSTCHQNDGFIIFHPDAEKDSTYIDVRGGWHDASDYLQYVTTSANAVYQMLFAYRENPSIFGDEYDAMGNPESNGIPDILDEAKWGLDWLDRMNPSYGEMYNQLADDRDHIGYKLPANDTADYGRGKGGARPAYFCTGEPQGSEKYKNRATGIASTAGKYASAFALGGILLEEYYPEFSENIKAKAIDAYKWGKLNPGVCQTAPHVAAYFYEEDNC
ncbi:glycoside hydrolase family 9 protein [Marinilabilia salmonicolor]|uniref:glycoside hydrolase family 9 protein n=1 Tax=Marinilabilia salmonicolor TaxID=989 RepID=UPI000A92720F|nr:glycoside hydrolase family 9 protein [Marinilabilia salmonicolor]